MSVLHEVSRENERQTIGHVQEPFDDCDEEEYRTRLHLFILFLCSHIRIDVVCESTHGSELELADKLQLLDPSAFRMFLLAGHWQRHSGTTLKLETSSPLSALRSCSSTFS